MAMHSTRLGLLALLLFAAATHVTADVDKALDIVAELELGNAAVTALSNALIKSSGPRADEASRSDVTKCWAGSALTCKLTAKCTASKCDCCSCACATLDCWFSRFTANYNQAAKLVPMAKTKAQRAVVAQTFCKVARINAPVTKSVVDLQQKAKCPGYTAKIKAIKGYQTNYSKWCKFFSG